MYRKTFLFLWGPLYRLPREEMCSGVEPSDLCRWCPVADQTVGGRDVLRSSDRFFQGSSWTPPASGTSRPSWRPARRGASWWFGGEDGGHVLNFNLNQLSRRFTHPCRRAQAREREREGETHRTYSLPKRWNSQVARLLGLRFQLHGRIRPQ